jgi:hypothetical protein
MMPVERSGFRGAGITSPVAGRVPDVRVAGLAGLLMVISQLAVGCGEAVPEREAQPTPESPAASFDPASEVPEGERLEPLSEVRWEIPPPFAGLPEGVMIAFLDGVPVVSRPFTFRLRFPANSGLMPHTHPATTRITVISGEMLMGMGTEFDRSALMAIPASQFIYDVKGTPHYVWFEEETILQFRGMGPFGIDYLDPADDPRL